MGDKATSARTRRRHGMTRLQGKGDRRGWEKTLRPDGQGPQMTRKRRKLECIEDVCSRILKTTLRGDGSETSSDFCKITQLGNGEPGIQEQSDSKTQVCYCTGFCQSRGSGQGRPRRKLTDEKGLHKDYYNATWNGFFVPKSKSSWSISSLFGSTNLPLAV